ncbi:MAG: hypothetical protein PHF67_02950 [Candidatus Nanoarchaeia archaeon]|nr:hypothetical protein [Candidatus Nanoarchaeia archaeon]
MSTVQESRVRLSNENLEKALKTMPNLGAIGTLHFCYKSIPTPISRNNDSLKAHVQACESNGIMPCSTLSSTYNGVADLFVPVEGRISTLFLDVTSVEPELQARVFTDFRNGGEWFEQSFLFDSPHRTVSFDVFRQRYLHDVLDKGYKLNRGVLMFKPGFGDSGDLYLGFLDDGMDLHLGDYEGRNESNGIREWFERLKV